MFAGTRSRGSDISSFALVDSRILSISLRLFAEYRLLVSVFTNNQLI